ncbi:nucleosome assembly protein 1-like 1 isoform X1 [Myripristis murdjan]|uniref:nucleosome assembly protein 1-like 1 isoform X1 n=1 Tax=Myripristis murdjan TaxID=586833 RepID=UPI0011762747|nr:nucleosome assembly protein 1-like 1 isoform X1 [Myripristis murdjan]
MADIDNKDQAELDPADMEDMEEVEEEETGEDVNSKARQLTVQMMQNPQILAALQERLDGLVGSPSGYMESLPKVVKRRVNALKNLQVKCAHIEAKFYEEVHELERKYAALYQPLFDKRSDIVKAAYEPTDEECEWKADEEEELTVSKQEEMKEKAKVEEEKKDEEKEDPKGIPEFWLTVFKNVDLLSDMLQEHDEPILKHLQDIKVKFSDPGQPMSFSLEFHFEPNDFFTNTVLTKTYKMRSEPDEGDPFSFDGPEIMGCTGCTIDWTKGKNVTLKTIKKKQKHKGRGTVRTVTKTVPNDSFFNFFTPPEVPESGELDEDSEAILAADFEIGHFIRERIVPRAVLYFTGEAIEDDDDDYDEEGEEADDEEGEEEADEENDPDYDPKKDANPPAECKQQ